MIPNYCYCSKYVLKANILPATPRSLLEERCGVAASFPYPLITVQAPLHRFALLLEPGEALVFTQLK